MRIKRLAGVFGRLDHEELRPEPGLNVIEAPNERGKSTWAALFRVMCYGLNTRDRSPTAEKRKFQPWDGGAMEGVLEAETAMGAVTVTRRTAGSGAPMGAYSAVYTGTGDPVQGLTSAGCGEALLGVPEDVYVRSAYIRQGGAAVDHCGALEQRIMALATTGEEEVSYGETLERLKKQLNARRYNRTGQLPRLERELEELRVKLHEAEALSQRISQDREDRDREGAELARLQAALARHDRADRWEAAQAVAQAEAELSERDQAAEGLPSREELNSINGAFDALQAVGGAVKEAESALKDAQEEQKKADDALRAHPFAPMTPEEAAAKAPEFPGKPRFKPLWAALAVLAGLILGGLVLWRSGRWLAAAGGGLGLTGLGLYAASLILRRRQQAWEKARDAGAEEFQNALSEYNTLFDSAMQAHAKAQAAKAAYRAVSVSYNTNAGHLASRIWSFCPGAKDLAASREAVEEAFCRHDELDRAKQALERARLRMDVFQGGPGDLPAGPVQRPPESREALARAVAGAQSRVGALDEALHVSEGRLQALGDPEQLRVELGEMEERHQVLQREYDAISLAVIALSDANTELQTRFAPALGGRAADIFAKLTGGRYTKVALDRQMVPSAQEKGRLMAHPAHFLSAGAADQLYLAVRLAICDLVLGTEPAPPMVLDDALVCFDDERLAAALDYLLGAAKDRQILLFTCQNREAAYLSKAHPGQFHYIKL